MFTLFNKIKYFSSSNSPCLFGNFFKQVIFKDFFPEKGQQNIFDYFFQCKLHIYGSICILFIIFLSGFIFLGVYNGFQANIKLLEEDPFITAIKISGIFNLEKLNKLEKLYYSPKANSFEFNADNGIRAIKGIYPFKKLDLRFLDKDKACLEDLHEVIAIRIPDGTKNKEIDKIGSDHWMLKWIIAWADPT